MGKIRINNMKFYTYNGVLQEEQVLGQNIEVDIEMTVPFEDTAAEDNLEKTISYADVYQKTKQYVETHSFKLMETVSTGLLNEICEVYQGKLEHLVIRVRKYHVPIAGIFDNIEIEVERRLSR